MRKNGVTSLFVNRNTDIGIDAHYRTVLSHVLTIVFRGANRHIKGLPVTRARARKLRKKSFTHVTIHYLPESFRDQASGCKTGSGYDERGFMLTFYRHRNGQRKRGEKDSEIVYQVASELYVLQWLMENGLESIYEIPHLKTRGFLPMLDEERSHRNALCNQVRSLFGKGPEQIPEKHFYRARLLTRFLELCKGDRVAALEAFAKTKLGSSNMVATMAAGCVSDHYYSSCDLGHSYAIYSFPNEKFVVYINLDTRQIKIETLKVDRNGQARMDFYNRFLTSSLFEESEGDLFTSLAGSMRFLKTPHAKAV